MSAAVQNWDPLGAPMLINKFLYFSDFFAIPVMVLVFVWLAFLAPRASPRSLRTSSFHS